MSKSTKKTPTKKTATPPRTPAKEPTEKSSTAENSEPAENKSAKKDAADESTPATQAVDEKVSADKPGVSPSREHDETDVTTVWDGKSGSANRFTMPMIALVIAVIGAVIYAVSVRSDLNEAEKQVADLRSELSDAQSALKKTAALRESEAAAFNEEKEQLDEKVAALESALDSSKSAFGELKDEKKEAAKELAQFKRFSAQFKRMIDAGKLEVEYRRGRMVVNLPAQVLFDSGSAELSEDGDAALKEVAKVLKTVKNKRFVVGGHTDDRKILRANYDSNWELATARATVVTKALVKAGVKPWNLIAAGYSQYAPVASNKSDKGRQKNRRIEIILEPYLKPIQPPDTGKKRS